MIFGNNMCVSSVVKQYYEGNADEIIERYRSISFEAVHSELAHLLFKRSLRILDVGAGIGRDALSLSRMGHVVIACEPSLRLRQYGEEYTRLSSVRWLDDSLPFLNKIREEASLFDVILVSAVWMHLDKDARLKSLATLRDLLFDDGFMYITYRTRSNDSSYLYCDIDVADFRQEVASSQLVVAKEFCSEDKEGRNGVRWFMFVVRK